MPILPSYSASPSASASASASNSNAPTAAASNRVLVLLTNSAFIPHKSRYEEECALAQLSPDASRNPKARCRSLTGVDIYELANLWLALSKRSSSVCQVDFASPHGGAVPSDPDSLERLLKDERLNREIRSMQDFITMVDHTWPIKAIRPQAYRAAIVVGSYGAMFDLPQCDRVLQCLQSIYYENNGYLCTIGHGSAVLANIEEMASEAAKSKAQYLVANKRVACPTNREEKEKRFDRILPFLLEDKLKSRGARIQESDPFKPNVIVDERLITAQNAASIREFVQKIAEKVFNKPVDL